MDLEELNEIIEVFKKSNISELEIKEGENQIILRRDFVEIPSKISKKEDKKNGIVKNISAKRESLEDSETIKSTMVGTFYRSSSPDAPPYVNVGDIVKEGDVVCIIETMKIINEVKSDKNGKIIDILVENGHPVEYGQPLFLIEREDQEKLKE